MMQDKADRVLPYAWQEVRAGRLSAVHLAAMQHTVEVVPTAKGMPAMLQHAPTCERGIHRICTVHML